MKKNMRKKALFATIIMILGILIFWVSSRWSVWFHNPEESTYVSQPEPHRVLLTFGDSTESSRNISWQADSILYPSHLELAMLPDGDTTIIKAEGEVFRSRSGQAAYYIARLRQLQPNASYAYRVVTNEKASSWYHFQTYAYGRDSISFLYVGDVQDSIGGEANRFLREALFFRHPQSEFLVCGGDLTERPIDAHWAETFRDIDSICQAMPLLNVTGNHDYLKGLPVSLERRFSLIFSYFLDSKVGDNQVYTLRYGPAQFFLLDSNRELPYLLTQSHWLEEQLSKSTARWKIVVLHHPLYSLKGYNNLIQRWVFKDLIENYGVDLVLQGHEHAYGRMTKHHDDGKAITPVYTVSHCSPKNYFIQFDERFDKFGISSRYYQTVSIKADTLTMATYEVYHHTLYDSLRIVKTGTEACIEDYGRNIPEYMEFTPDLSKKKDRAYAERIKEYKARHPERQ